MKGLFRFFGRLFNLIGMTANDTLDALEKPERVLEEKITKAHEAQTTLARAHAQSVAQLNLQKSELVDLEKQESKYHNLALQARQHGADEDAILALERKQAITEQIQTQKQTIAAMQAQTENLSQQMKDNKEMLTSATQKHKLLKNKIQAARAQNQIALLMTTADHTSITEDLKKLDQDAQLLTDEAQVLIETKIQEEHDPLEKRIKSLGQPQHMQDQLAMLDQELGIKRIEKVGDTDAKEDTAVKE